MCHCGYGAGCGPIGVSQPGSDKLLEGLEGVWSRWREGFDGMSGAAGYGLCFESWLFGFGDFGQLANWDRWVLKPRPGFPAGVVRRCLESHFGKVQVVVVLNGEQSDGLCCFFVN